MRRRYLSIATITLLLATLLLSSGCGVRINGKDYELFSSNKKDNSSVLNAVGSDVSDDFSTSEERLDSEKITLTVNSGNVELKKSNTSQIKIEADKRVRGASKSDKDVILNNMNIKIVRDGKSANIMTMTKDNDDFWDWVKENYKGFQVSINFTIYVPEGINAINLYTGAGNIDVEDISTELSIVTGAGNIDIEKVTAMGNNKLSTGAGNIDFDGNVDAIEAFEVSTGAGNIDFEIPEASKISLQAHTGVGRLSGSFIQKDENNKHTFEGDINGGGPIVNINSGVGNVSVDNN